jgi:WD40 repeat protein/serine/threonine protein kinase
MTREQAEPSLEQRVDEAIAAYLEAVDRDPSFDREEFLARYPDLAAELRSYFADHDELNQLADPLRSAHRGEPTAPPTPSLAAPAVHLQTNDTRFGEYELLREVARGGMGVVYEAQQVRAGRVVALKMILAGPLASAADVQRFRGEAEKAASLDHPHIVPIYEVGEHQGQPYFTMKFCDGGSLAEHMGEFRLPLLDPKSGRDEAGKHWSGAAIAARKARSVDLLAAVARAVHYAHQHGILHRDLKPANILLDAQGEPHVTDFGLAKRVELDSAPSQPGAVVGTPTYMAPEQASGQAQRLSTAADVYSLGAIFYELLTGQPPFRGETPLATLRQVQESEPVRPRLRNPLVDRDLETICLKCLEKEPRQRYGTAEALAEDLERWRRGEPIQARPSSAWERAVKWAKRRPAVAVLVVSVILITVLGVGGVIWQWRRAEAAHGRVQEALDDVRRQKQQADDARREAESAREQEQQAREGAQRAADDSRSRLVRLAVANGVRNLDEDDSTGALPWFAEALRADAGDPGREEMHRVRLGALLRQCPRPVRVWGPAQHQLTYVRGAAFSPDGRRVVLAGQFGTAGVWDVSTGDPVTPPLKRGPPGFTFPTAFSPDGRYVVTNDRYSAATADEVRVWDAVTGEPVTPPLGGKGDTLFLGFSPDSRRMAAAAADHTVRVSDVVTGKPITPPMAHGARVNHLVFSPDGRRLATATADHMVRVWDATTGQPLTPPLPHGAWAQPLAFSPDGHRLVTMCGESVPNEVRLWDVETGKPVRPPIKCAAQVGEASFSPDGRRFLTVVMTPEGEARVWDSATGEPVTPAMTPGFHATFSADGRRVLTFDKMAHLWDAATGKPIAPPVGHRAAVCQAAFSPDGRRLVTAAFPAGGWGTSEARVWDALSGEALTPPLKMFGGASGVGIVVSFSPDGRRLLTTDAVGVAVWDLETPGWALPLVQHADQVTSVSFRPDGRQVLTTSRDGTCRIWDAASGKEIVRALMHPLPVHGAAFSPDGRRVVTGCGETAILVRGTGEARVWNAETGEPVTPPIPHQGGVAGVVFSPDGRRIATVATRYDPKSTPPSLDGEARVWDAATGKPLTPPLKHDCPMYSAQFSPDGGRLLTIGMGVNIHGGPPSKVRVWDAATGEPVTPPLESDAPPGQVSSSPGGCRVKLLGQGGTYTVWDSAWAAEAGNPVGPPAEPRGGYLSFVVLRPDLRRAVVAGPDSARVWGPGAEQPITPPLKVRGIPRQCEFSADGRRLMTAAARLIPFFENGRVEGEVRLWDATTGEPVSGPLRHDAQTPAAVSADGRRLATVNGNRARVWDLSPDGRPVADLVLLADLLSGHRIDATGGYVPLGAGELCETWQKLRSRYPGEFGGGAP